MTILGKVVLLAVIILSNFTTANAMHPYTVIANPGEMASSSVRLSWHTPLGGGQSKCIYTTVDDSLWLNAQSINATQEFCNVYDSIYSKTADNKDFYENARFLRNTVMLDRLKPDMLYIYKIDSDSTIRYFKTAPTDNRWTAAVISDFHAYTPLPNRTKSAMAMIDTLEQVNGREFDLMLHVGDITAWGGSYSFWKDLYANKQFKKYTWAGVNGNHDNMSRGYARLSNTFFRYANNNPANGYDGEVGVCYHFTYGNTLFIMLNNESMRSEEGLAQAQEWVKNVINKHKSQFIIVVEHYQWFFGTTGKASQYDRWKRLFDECGVDLAISGNNHVYVRTNALFNGVETNGNRGTVYIQTPSSDNERGQDLQEWTDNRDIIKRRWSEGTKTVGALILNATNDKLSLTLYDRHGNAIDTAIVKAKRK